MSAIAAITPAPRSRGGAYRRQPAPSDHERVLGNVLAGRAIPNRGVRHAADQPLMPRDDLAERRGISPTARRDQLRIALRIPSHVAL
jgi:hypothetical protein